ncbi:MAG: hypothetical protein RR929_01050 [Erysipelotrichaceae bacterium]
MERIAFRTTKELKEELEEIASKEEVTTSFLAEHLIHLGLKEFKDQNK